MRQKTYIRPLGFLYGPCAEAACKSGHALALGDCGIAFSLTELSLRSSDGKIARSFAPATELADTASKLSTPRLQFAGLSMDRPRIMGIVNVTPDSFSDGGQFSGAQDAVDHALRLAEEGADILDIGGESTRPGAKIVSIEDELARVIPVIEGLAGRTAARLSIDTRNAEVMRRAAAAGVHIINDVSALTHDPESLAVAAQTGLPVILMHAQGTPQNMQDNPSYDDVLLDVFDYLAERMQAAVAAGIPTERLMVDPGIGFGKTLDHNLQLLAGISLFHSLGVPILLGVSRKRILGMLADKTQPRERVPGSIAAALTSIAQGVQLIRVHDVAETKQALNAWQACISGAEG